MNLHLFIAAAALAFSTYPLNAMDMDLPDAPEHVGAHDFYEDENVESLDHYNEEDIDENHAGMPAAEDEEELDDDMIESPLGDDPESLEEEDMM